MQIVGDATKARFIATIIDNTVAVFLTIGVVSFVPENLSVLRILLLIGVFLGYFFILEGLWARTLGKYLQGLVVQKLDGSPAGWKIALIRTILRVIEVNPVLLGALPAGLVLISSERKQRLGDILAGSIVVSDKQKWNLEQEAISERVG